MSRNKHFFDSVRDRVWYHGTDHRSADAISEGQKADFRGLQQSGPGMYVTPWFDNAEAYARSAAKYRGSDVPVVQAGEPRMEKPISLTSLELRNIGRQFRRKNPSVPDQYSEADLGNIALRKKGYDFLHINTNASGDHPDTGVILRPKRWTPIEDIEV